MLGVVWSGRGGIPWRLAKRMTECLPRFAIRVSRGPGSASADKLKCISPIPISTTPEATVVQMIRDRIRFSSAAGYNPQCAELFSATQRPKREYERHKKVQGPKSPRMCDPR
jgi:hypothetical protein